MITTGTHNTATTWQPWSAQKANKWYRKKGWLVGCNYAPSTATTQLDMWGATDFDAATIDRELSWASKLGFNAVRVGLHHQAWKQDAEGLKARMETFLAIADSYNIGAMFVIFEGMWSQNIYTGTVARNTDPEAEVLKALAKHDTLEGYVKDVIGHFADDRRIHIWDVFSDLDNAAISLFGKSDALHRANLNLMLLQKAFGWARAVKPSQPLTAGVWNNDLTDEKLTAVDRFMLNASDVITFRNTSSLADMEQRVKVLQRFRRPILCTEFALHDQQNFEAIRPLLQQHNVSVFNAQLLADKGCQRQSGPWTTNYTNDTSLHLGNLVPGDGKLVIPEDVHFVASFTSNQGLQPGNIQYSPATKAKT